MNSAHALFIISFSREPPCCAASLILLAAFKLPCPPPSSSNHRAQRQQPPCCPSSPLAAPSSHPAPKPAAALAEATKHSSDLQASLLAPASHSLPLPSTKQRHHAATAMITSKLPQQPPAIFHRSNLFAAQPPWQQPSSFTFGKHQPPPSHAKAQPSSPSPKLPLPQLILLQHCHATPEQPLAALPSYLCAQHPRSLSAASRTTKSSSATALAQRYQALSLPSPSCCRTSQSPQCRKQQGSTFNSSCTSTSCPSSSLAPPAAHHCATAAAFSSFTSREHSHPCATLLPKLLHAAPSPSCCPCSLLPTPLLPSLPPCHAAQQFAAPQPPRITSIRKQPSHETKQQHHLLHAAPLQQLPSTAPSFLLCQAHCRSHQHAAPQAAAAPLFFTKAAPHTVQLPLCC